MRSLSTLWYLQPLPPTPCWAARQRLKSGICGPLLLPRSARQEISTFEASVRWWHIILSCSIISISSSTTAQDWGLKGRILQLAATSAHSSTPGDATPADAALSQAKIRVTLPNMPQSTLGEKLESQRLWWNKQLDVRAFLVFQRLLRFYNTFVILSALISGLAVAALTFPDFHPSTSGVGEVGEGLLCSSAVTGVLSAVMATMLLFAFEGFERATRTDLAVAWSPLVLLDISIIEFLVGIVCWYWAKNVAWRGALVAVELGSLMGCCVALSVWVWLRLSTKGGLGLEERQLSTEQERAADA